MGYRWVVPGGSLAYRKRTGARTRPRVVPHDDDRQPSPGPYGPGPATAGDRARCPQGRRGRPGDRVAQAELRQGAVPRPAPAGPDRSVAAGPAPESVANGGGVPGRRSRSSLATKVDNEQIERDARIPDEVITRPGRARRVRHEDRQDVRRARVCPIWTTAASLMMIGSANASLSRAALGAPVDRRTAAAEALRHRRSRSRSSCPGWPPARSPRSCSPSRTWAPTRPGCPPRPCPRSEGRATCSTA